MNSIEHTDPTVFLSTTNSLFFLIGLNCEEGRFLWTDQGFFNADKGSDMRSPLTYTRQNYIEAYWRALRFARAEFGQYPDKKFDVKGILYGIPL